MAESEAADFPFDATGNEIPNGADHEPVPVNPVIIDGPPIIDGSAPDKSLNESRNSELNDTFARNLDPAELAFQRDQMKQIEDEIKEERYRE